MFTAALFTIGKQSEYPSMGEWVNKIHYIHTMQYDTTIKKE